MILEETANQIKTCQKCHLHQKRTHAVPGNGNPQAKIVFIGEAPGANEDKNGIPFCGAAGKLLDELLQNINLKRKDIFITNMVKCRPPGNRDPLPEELEACRPFLEQQLENIKPQIVITLGRFAMGKFLKDVYISKVHGKKFKVGNFYLVPMYHPAAGLYRGEIKKLIFEDFSKLPEYLQKIAEEREKDKQKQIKQIGLF